MVANEGGRGTLDHSLLGLIISVLSSKVATLWFGAVAVA